MSQPTTVPKNNFDPGQKRWGSGARPVAHRFCVNNSGFCGVFSFLSGGGEGLRFAIWSQVEKITTKNVQFTTTIITTGALEAVGEKT